MVGFAERQVTVRGSEPSAFTFAVTSSVSPALSVRLVGDTVTPRTTGVTVTVALLRRSVSATDTAVIATVPSDTPVTTPVLETLTMLGSLERHVTAVLSPGSIVTVAARVRLVPMFTVDVAGEIET